MKTNRSNTLEIPLWAGMTAAAVLCSSLISTAHAEETPELAAQRVRGKVVFNTCAACHGSDGKGLPTNPPMAPSLVGSKLATGPAEVPAVIAMKGILKADTKFIGIMAPLETALTDEQLADVLTYIRTSFGNTASAVSSAETKAWREKYKNIKQSLSRTAYEKKAEAILGAASPGSTAPASAPAPAAAEPAK